MAFRFYARGHPSIQSTHPTTLEIIKEPDLTARGDCIVAVGASKGLTEISADLKSALSQEGAKGQLVLVAGTYVFKVQGSGDPRLTFSHPSEIVVRKSGFISERTLLVNTDNSASDIPREMVRLLQDERCQITVEISVTSPQPHERR